MAGTKFGTLTLAPKTGPPVYYPELDLATLKLRLNTSKSNFRRPWPIQQAFLITNIQQEVQLN